MTKPLGLGRRMAMIQTVQGRAGTIFLLACGSWLVVAALAAIVAKA
jgi:hypothetical protein